MKKRKQKKENVILVDLTERKNIKIIRSKNTSITDDAMQEFENLLQMRYEELVKFTDLCIDKNRSVTPVSMIDEKYRDSMKNMIEQNQMLEDMIKHK